MRADDMDGDRLLTPSAAARKVGCSTGSIYRWIRSQDLRATRLKAGGYRIRESDVDALLVPADQWTRRPSAADAG